MIIHITTQKYETYDCEQNNVFAVLGDLFNINITPIFWSDFDFKYSIDKKSPSILSGIDIDYNNKYHNAILKKVVGIEKITESNLNFRSFINKINYQINKGVPLGLCIDSYYLHWNDYYQQINRDHFISICGINFEEGILYCGDGFLTNKIQKLSIKDAFENYKSLSEYHVYSNKTDIKDDIKILLTSIKKNNRNKSEHLIKFSSDMVNLKLSDKDIIYHNNILLSSYIFLISRTAWSRYNFYLSLKYFKDKYGIDSYQQCIDESEKVSKLWQRIKNIFIKSLLITDDCMEYLKKASELIMEVSNIENVLQKMIISICEKYLTGGQKYEF